MYNIAYFQLVLNTLKEPSFVLFKELNSNKLINQPIIFCDIYNIETNIPVFHSSYINQHFHKKLILADFDQINYIEHFKNQHFLILYNPLTQTPQTQNKNYLYISIEDNATQFLENYCNEYKTI